MREASSATTSFHHRAWGGKAPSNRSSNINSGSDGGAVSSLSRNSCSLTQSSWRYGSMTLGVRREAGTSGSSRSSSWGSVGRRLLKPAPELVVGFSEFAGRLLLTGGTRASLKNARSCQERYRPDPESEFRPLNDSQIAMNDRSHTFASAA